MLNISLVSRVLTNKADVSETKLDTQALRTDLADGEVLFKITRLALTANNITYAAFGDAMQYWCFFPTGQEGWGHMPAWGFADVVASNTDGLVVGERFFGYFPLASYLHMLPLRITSRGFYDGAPYRQDLISAYNQYTRCSSDTAYSHVRENLQMLIRPLFLTSFMLADFLADHAFFGATRLVISSASSKTAYGTAFCLRYGFSQSTKLEIVALTSDRNRAYVKKLDCYQQVLSYDELEKLPVSEKTLYIDFTGDNDLRARIHLHFADALVYDCFAGSTQNSNFLVDAGLPGPKPVFYFAPVQVRKRNSDWGVTVLNKRLNDDQRQFLDHLSQPKLGWLDVVEHHGLSDTGNLIQQLAKGNIDPSKGHIVLIE